MPLPHIWPRRTERLELRAPSEADLDAVLGWRNHPDVTRWLLHTEAEPVAFREGWHRAGLDPRDHSAVAVTGAGAVVGTLSLEVGDGMGQGRESPARGSEGLLGYLLDPAHHGRGYAT